MNNLIVAGVIVLVALSSILLFNDVFINEDVIEPSTSEVVNPSTNERWDSVEEFRFRNKEVSGNG